MTRALIITLIFVAVFTIFTAVFAISANKAEVRLLPKWVWVLLCILVPFFGGLLYLMVGRPLRAKPSGPTGKTKRVVAPDDDPNFLKDLSEKLKREEDDNKDDKSK
ncbi:MAG: hypothetical protein RIQ37_313 [Actinomycetota bacterium]|jgi:hypothetical protein